MEPKMLVWVKALVISLTFAVGFFLLETVLSRKLKDKKVYCFLIEITYFLGFWTLVYIYFLC